MVLDFFKNLFVWITARADSVAGITTEHYFTEYANAMGPVTRLTFNFTPYYKNGSWKQKHHQTLTETQGRGGKHWFAYIFTGG